MTYYVFHINTKHVWGLSHALLSYRVTLYTDARGLIRARTNLGTLDGTIEQNCNKFC